MLTLGLNDEENESESENSSEKDVDNEEDSEDDENEKNLNNDMSDLKEDDECFDNEETNSISKEDDKKISTKLFAQKLKEKKVIMDEARKQLPYTFTGNHNIIKKQYNKICIYCRPVS